MNKTTIHCLLICSILLLGILAFFSPIPEVYAEEEMTNGGFEIGSGLTGWSHGGDSGHDAEIKTDLHPHTGHNETWLDDGWHCWVNQTFSPSVTGSSVSTATFWTWSIYSGSPPEGAYFQVIVGYTDSTTDSQTWEHTSDMTWVQRDFKSIINTAKEINSIKIWNTAEGVNQFGGSIDDVSLITAAPTYECNVVSDPEIAAEWELDGTPYTTPWNDNIIQGVKRLEATETTAIRDSGQNMYGFTHWMVTNSSGSFNITDDEIFPDIQSEHNFTLFYDDSYTVRVDSTPYTSATFTATAYAFTAPKVLVRYADNHTFVCTLFEVDVNASYKYTFDHWSINGSGYYGSLSIDVDIQGDTNLTMHYLGSWIPTPYIPTFAYNAINGTWYFRSDTHTIHELLGYKLDFVNTYTSTYTTRTQSHFTLNVSYGIRVWIIDVFGNNYELSGGTPEAIVSRSSDGDGYQSAYFECPAYAGLIDAVQVNLYQRFNTDPWSLRRYFITDENLYFKLPASSWTIIYYTNRTTASTTAYFFHGSTTFNSRILFQYYKANPWELALARLQAQQYLAFMTTPWTYYLGDIFWSLLLLFGIVTMYNKQGSLKPILALLWLLGGVGSVLSALIPTLVLHIAWLMLAVAMGITLFKLIYR